MSTPTAVLALHSQADVWVVLGVSARIIVTDPAISRALDVGPVFLGQ